MAGRNNISYVKPAEPAFIRRIKEKVGFKEGPTIETKKEVLALDDNDERNEKDDEKPVVVVLEAGDLSQEEADSIVLRLQDEERKVEEENSKITYTKPVKRSASEENASSTNKKHKSPARKLSSDGEKKKVKNKSLLSFNDEENDD